MEHRMGLYEAPFQSMKSGEKTVEVRLYDNKRRKLKIGDTIQFTKVPDSNETIKAEVIGLKTYSTFREMYENIPANDLDAADKPVDEMVEQTYQIYSPESENKWGTVAISLKILDG